MAPREPALASPLAGGAIGLPAGQFVVAEWSDDGSRFGRELAIAGLHVHHRDDEAWYVLEGRLGFRVGERELEAPAGAAVFVPRGTPHSYWNAQPAPARYLIVMTPAIWQLVSELHASGTPRERFGEIFARYGSELLDG